ASCAQSARPKFHSALEPSDDFSIGEQSCRLFGQLRFAFRLIVLDAVIVQPALDVGAGEFWSEKTALLRITFFDRSGFFQQLMPDKEGSAQRAARVPRRRLNPDRFEGSLTQESSAGHTVQCHAAGEYQIAQFRLLMKAAGKS